MKFILLNGAAKATAGWPAKSSSAANSINLLHKERLIGAGVGLPRSVSSLGPRSLIPFHCRISFIHEQINLFIHSTNCFHSISSTHLLSLAAHPSISFISFNQFTFWFVNWWRNERLWAHYTATDLRQQIKNYSTIS